MRYIQNISREQTRLLPYSVEEMVEETNPVRVIHAYVDSLPMETLGFERAEPAQTGRPAYDPRDLLKLYIYGYLNRILKNASCTARCPTWATSTIRMSGSSIWSISRTKSTSRPAAPRNRKTFRSACTQACSPAAMKEQALRCSSKKEA